MSVGTLPAAPAPLRFASLAVAALRAVSWRQLRAAMLLGLALSVFNAIIFAIPMAQILRGQQASAFFLGNILSDQIKVLCLLVALVIADRAVDEGVGRRRAYVAAALAGCALGIALSIPVEWAWRAYVLPDVWPAERPWLHGRAYRIYWPIFAFTNWLLIGGSVAFLYADRRAARRTADLLHAANLDRLRRSRLALESRLQAMQARVEPQFLFNTLAQVERLYQTEPKLADRMLDDLIAYLRAAMPLMRSSSSTLGQEIDLARAYLDIARIRLGDRLDVAIDVPSSIIAVRMPPMVLLPLVDHAIVYGLDEATGDGSIRIGAAMHDGKLRLHIDDRGAGLLVERQDSGIDEIRQRLKALYGEKARLDLRQNAAGGTQAALEVPVEVSDATAHERDAARGA